MNSALSAQNAQTFFLVRFIGRTVDFSFFSLSDIVLCNPRINLTHEQIAKYMGSAREVVSRMLKYFAKEGMIEMSRGGIRILDKEKLRELTV